MCFGFFCSFDQECYCIPITEIESAGNMPGEKKKTKQGGKRVLVLPNTKDMTRATKWV